MSNHILKIILLAALLSGCNYHFNRPEYAPTPEDLELNGLEFLEPDENS